jgi:hypothetical protein
VRAASVSISTKRLSEAPLKKVHVSMPGPMVRQQHCLHLDYVACVAAEGEVTLDKEAPEEVKTEKDPSPLIPTAFEIQSLIMEVCDETSIAELQLKVPMTALLLFFDMGYVSSFSLLADMVLDLKSL